MKPLTVPASTTTKVPGWRNADEEEQAIIRLASDIVPNENGIIVEIGTEYGRGASELAFAARNKNNVTIVSIDLFPTNHPEVGDLWKCWQDNINEAKHLFPNVRFVPIRGASAEVGAMLVAEGKLSHIDFLFIDGAHDANSVRLDLETFGPLVTSEGAILIHDYWKNETSHYIHKEVKQAVDAWRDPKAWSLVDLPGSLVVLFPLAQSGELAQYAPPAALPDFNDTFRETLIDDEPTEPVTYGGDDVGDYTIAEIAEHLDVSYHKARELMGDIEPIGKRGRANVYRVALGDLGDE